MLPALQGRRATRFCRRDAQRRSSRWPGEGLSDLLTLTTDLAARVGPEEGPAWLSSSEGLTEQERTTLDTPDKEGPAEAEPFFSSPAVPVRVNRRIGADHPIRRTIIIGRRAIDRWPIVDWGCRCGGQCPRNQPKSNSWSDSRTTPVVMTPMSRCRCNRPDEERCCRGDSKSKLSHVHYLTYLQRRPQKRAAVFPFQASFRQTAVRLEVQVRTVSAHFKSFSHASDEPTFGSCTRAA